MQALSNDRNVKTIININNPKCYVQDIPCYYCKSVTELSYQVNNDDCIVYVYSCVHCNARLELTYRPFIKDAYCLEHEKWTTN